LRCKPTQPSPRHLPSKACHSPLDSQHRPRRAAEWQARGPQATTV
jgi:hypothetical protein